MAAPEQQHYVPRFLLKQWITLPGDELSTFRWAHGELRHSRHTVKAVAKSGAPCHLRAHRHRSQAASIGDLDVYLPQILSVSVFEKTQLSSALEADPTFEESIDSPNQLILFKI